MKKISSGTILALLLLSALLIFLPAGTVRGSTGNTILGTVNVKTSAAVFTAASSFVGVIAGSDAATNDATTPLTSFFAINFNTVTFSGSQYYVYLSKDGFASLDAGDVRYAGPFFVANLSQPFDDPAVAHHNTVTEANGTFIQGTTALSAKILEGPIPIRISGDYKYVKVFDGSTTAVSVSTQTVTVVPGITITPAKGAPGQVVSVQGGGFPTSSTVDLQYSFTWNDWEGASHTVPASGFKNLTTGISTGAGYFTQSAVVPDAKQALNGIGGPYPNVAINFVVKGEAAPHPTYAAAVFTQFTRFISEVVSLDNSGTCVASTGTSCVTPFSSTTFYGNSTGTGTGPAVINGVTGTVANIPTLNAKNLGSLVIAGNFSFAGAPVTFWIGTTQIGNTTADTAGTFNGTANLPTLSQGSHTVLVQSDGVTYQFNINVLPTLILTPKSGPVGTTVTATAYGFPGNSFVSLWWNRHSFSGANNDYYLINGTVGTNGSFNVTMTFTVPNTYGGPHSIDATTDMWPSPVLESTLTAGGGFITSGTFTVTPTLSISSSSFANDGSFITVTGTGLKPVGCAGSCGPNLENPTYQALLDNAPFSGGLMGEGATGNTFLANDTGAISIVFIASGFRPGMHVFAIYDHEAIRPIVSDGEPLNNTYTPAAWVTFTVTTANDPIATQITALGTTISGLSSSLASIQSSLTAVQSSLTAVQTSLTTITSDVSGLGTQLTAVQTSLTSITSSVSGLGTQLTAIQTSLTSITSTLNSAAADAHTAAQQATAAATAATNASSGNSTAQTYVLVVAVLAAITLVLELAILVRKLS